MRLHPILSALASAGRLAALLSACAFGVKVLAGSAGSVPIAVAAPVPAPTRSSAAAAPSPSHLSGELSAEEILDGRYAFPASPEVPTAAALHDAGLNRARLGRTPQPGVHPRLLLSPDELPDLRRRLRETNVGRALYATLQTRLRDALRQPKNWGGELYAKLAQGDAVGAEALVRQHRGLPPAIGHYQPYFYALVLEAFDALVVEDAARGRQAATAIATYAALVRPGIAAALAAPLGDDVWRAKTSGPHTGSGFSDQGMRDGVGGHLLGYAYDFAYPYMTDAQRAAVRATIAQATAGRLWMGARLPHHFRNWNWIAVGLQQPLLALAIEGEEGYDPRVYRLGVEIARDYLTYGISAQGMSTEAVGYTQFGFVWANPFIVAATRRGDNLLCHPHHRAMLDWYLHSMEPSRDHWTSHGDGGDAGPALWTLSMWRYFFPADAKARSLWRSLQHSSARDDFLGGKSHLLEPLLWADADPGLDDPQALARDDLPSLGLPLTLFDRERGSLLVRTSWKADATVAQFEARADSHCASHEHADRGSFTLSAHGRSWAKENFRSVETRHHNSVLIDGLGQGFWPGPATWLGCADDGAVLIASCDLKDNYGTFAPKQILTEDPDTFARFRYPRWESYAREAREFHALTAGLPRERDPHPVMQKFWTGFTAGDPRMWDEDSWPVRFPHNPVRRAFRTFVFVRGEHPCVLLIDDIQKDDTERLYEWLLQTGPNTAVASLTRDEALLCDATVPRDAEGRVRPARGERELLVRILAQNEPARAIDYQARPSLRLETFERRDTLKPENTTGALSGARSFGLDQRLVVPARAVSPGFKILLYPRREGEPLPVTTWNHDRTELRLVTGAQKRTFRFTVDAAGRTLVRAVAD